jgi:hypothetical protein
MAKGGGGVGGVGELRIKYLIYIIPLIICLNNLI